MHASTLAAQRAGSRAVPGGCSSSSSSSSIVGGAPAVVAAAAARLRHQSSRRIVAARAIRHETTTPQGPAAPAAPAAAAAAAVARPHAAPAPTPQAAAAAAAAAAAPHSAAAALSGGGAVRRMIILRHADSESSTRLRDYDRPISQQGKREAAKVAAQLSELGWVPDLIIASNSKRTKQTLDTMAEAASELALVDAHYLGSLYTVAALDGQTKHHLEETIRSVASDAANFCVMCVGHNKGWEEAASAFAQETVRLSTASAALFETVGASWEEVTAPETEWKLVQVITP